MKLLSVPTLHLVPLIFLVTTLQADNSPSLLKLSWKDKYALTKMLLTGGTLGTSDLLKTKLAQGAALAKSAMTTSVDHAQLAAAQAQAGYAQGQVHAAQHEIEILKKALELSQHELAKVRQELEATKQALAQAQR